MTEEKAKFTEALFKMRKENGFDTKPSVLTRKVREVESSETTSEIKQPEHKENVQVEITKEKLNLENNIEINSSNETINNLVKNDDINSDSKIFTIKLNRVFEKLYSSGHLKNLYSFNFESYWITKSFEYARKITGNNCIYPEKLTDDIYERIACYMSDILEKEQIMKNAKMNVNNNAANADSDFTIYEGIDFFQKVGETIHEYNDRIANDVYGKKYKDLTKKEQVKLEDIEQNARIQKCESDEEVKDFDIETAKKLYKMLGCIQLENAWVNVNHLSSAINNTTVRNKLKKFRFKKVENGKERISDYGEYLVTSSLNDPNFPFYQRIAFKPFNEGLDEFEYNLWKENVYEDIQMDERGWKLLDFIKKIICKDRQTIYSYIEKWIAFIIQKDEKTQAGIAIRGDGGEGKGRFVLLLEKLLNEKFYFINDIEEIHSRFNAHLFNKTIICINDANGKGRGIESIKSKVTDDNFRYEIKCGAVVTDAKNHFNFIVLSNDDLEKLVPQLDEANKRRWIILETSKEHQNDFDYFGKIMELLNDREVIQMLGNYFKRINIEGWIPMDIPDTDEKKRAEIEQNTFLEYIVQSNLSDDNFKEKDGELWIEKDILYNYYNEWFSNPKGGGYDTLTDSKKIVKSKSLALPPIYLTAFQKKIRWCERIIY